MADPNGNGPSFLWRDWEISSPTGITYVEGVMSGLNIGLIPEAGDNIGQSVPFQEIGGVVGSSVIPKELLPIRPPGHLMGADFDKQAAFYIAFSKALSLLDNGQCASLFGANAKDELSTATYEYVKITTSPNQPYIPSELIFAANPEGTNTILVNTAGHFFPKNDGSVPYDGGIGLWGANLQAFVLLHELGHVTGTAKDDSINSALSWNYVNSQFDKDIKSKCINARLSARGGPGR